MHDDEASKFRIQINEENPDSQFQDDIEELQTVKLNRRITRVSILTIALMVAVFLFIYMDLKKNLSKMNRSGDMEIQTLSKGMQSQFSSLSLQQAKFEEALAKKIAPLETAVVSIQTKLKETSTAIKRIRSARKADNEKTTSAIEAVNKTLTPVPKKLENLEFDMDKIDQKYTNEFSNLSRMAAQIKNQLIQIQSEIDALEASKLDKKTLDIELADQHKTVQQTLGQFTRDMEDKLLSIEKKIKQLKAIGNSGKGHKPPNSQETSLPEQQKFKPAHENAISKPGTIIEQDIQ